MPKLTLPTVQSGYYTSTALNAIFDQIELEFDKVFYRTNPVGTPNSLSNDIDLNGNDVLNGGSAFFDKLILQGMDFTEIVMNAPTTISNYLTQAEAARDAAQASEIAAASSASSSSSSASAAAFSASAASTSASNASASASLAAASEAQALASANSAATSESAAAGYAAAALASQTAAATSESNAAASEAVVLASEANVTAMEATVQSLSDNFRGTYYGALAADPSVDPLGNAPTEGDLYFNTTTNTLRLFDGSSWNLASVDPSTLGTAATYNVATNAQALAGTAGVLPDAADVHETLKKFGLGTKYKATEGASGFFKYFYTVSIPPLSEIPVPFPDGATVSEILVRGVTLNTSANTGFIGRFIKSNSGVWTAQDVYGTTNTTPHPTIGVSGGVPVFKNVTSSTYAFSWEITYSTNVNNTAPSAFSFESSVFHPNNGAASSAEALAGTDLTKWMSPQRVHESFKQFGFGTNGDSRTRITDLNTHTRAGFFVYAAGATGAPDSFSGYVWHQDWDGSALYNRQIAFNSALEKIYFRHMNAGVWGAWVELHHSGNASSGRNLQLVWSGSATSVDLDTLAGGHPGTGTYIINNDYEIFISDGLTTSNVGGCASTGTPASALVFWIVDVVLGNTIEINRRQISGTTVVNSLINISSIHKVV